MTERWRDVAQATGLTAPDGTVRATIFAEMTALAQQFGAANLGQGFPDEDGPAWIRQVASEAIVSGANQYPPGRGIPALREAIAAHQFRHYGLRSDPATEVLVTAGATEALTAAVLALTGPGDKVVTIEPFYDSHAAAIALSGATHVTVPLVPTTPAAQQAGAGPFRLDVETLDRVISAKTRVILINSPHNPTGTVLGDQELQHIAAAARRAGAVVVTDEVYEHLVFGDRVHTPIASLPGMAERTLTISSAGKTFSLTGWKIGWAVGPAELIEAMLTVKQFLTYSGGAPFQPAIARALVDGDPDIAVLRTSLDLRKDTLVAGLQDAGFTVAIPDGTYFVCADATPFLTAELPDGDALARLMPELIGVACIPLTAFCIPGSAPAATLAPWLRFTFVKDEDTLRLAVTRLRGLRDALAQRAAHGHED